MSEKTHGIGWAVKQMWNKRCVARRGWNGKNMFVFLARPDVFDENELPFVMMRTADAKLVPWLCSQTDLLATDWDFCK